MFQNLFVVGLWKVFCGWVPALIESLWEVELVGKLLHEVQGLAMNGRYSSMSVMSEDSTWLLGLPCLYMKNIIALEMGILKMRTFER